MAAHENRSRVVGTVRSPFMLDDLLADLLWPKLLRAPVLALSPARIGLAGFFVLLGVVSLSILGSLESAAGWKGGDDALAHWARVRATLLSWPDAAAPGKWGSVWISAALAFPGAAIRAHPLVSTLGSVIAMVLWCVGGGALSRSCVCELGGNIRCSWPQSLGFSAGRWTSSVGAMLIPGALVTLLAFACSVGGLVLLRVPGVNLLGSVLFGGFLVCAAVGVIVLALYAVGHPLLLPAVAADGSDAVDAIQRAYAYVLGRPARYAAYTLISVVQGAVVIGIAAALVGAVTTFAGSAAGQWAGESGRTAIAQAHAAAVGGEAAEKEVLRDAAVRQAAAEQRELPTAADARPERFAVFGWGARVIEVWYLLAGLVLAGFAASYVHAAGSILYLLMRRLNDGQDLTEIWQAREPDETAPPPAVNAAVGDAD